MDTAIQATEMTPALEPAVQRTDWSSPYLQAPATLGLAGGVLLVCLATPSVLTIGCALGLVVAGVIAGRRLKAKNAAALDAARALERSVCAAPWSELATELLPAWQSEVQSTRETADQAVQRLAQGFSQMVVGLTAALAESKQVTVQSAGGGVAATIAQSSERLQAVIELLKTLQAAKQSVLEHFAVYARNLREMAADVQAIATQIKLVALNGSIEAARAGEQGKAFAVVVAEMRQLAAKSAELGVRISANLQTVNGTLERSFCGKQRPGGEDVSPITKADEHVKSVLGAFAALTQQLSGSISSMEQRSEALKREISDALVDFQFQDRVSQQLAWLAGAMDCLRQDAAGGSHEHPGWGSQLRRLAARDEAHGIHKGGSNRGRPSEITYF